MPKLPTPKLPPAEFPPAAPSLDKSRIHVPQVKIRPSNDSPLKASAHILDDASNSHPTLRHSVDGSQGGEGEPETPTRAYPPSSLANPLATPLSQPTDGFDRGQMLEGMRLFLQALGPSVYGADLSQTPERVVETWTREFLAGYFQDPVAILAERFPLLAATSSQGFTLPHSSNIPTLLANPQATAAIPGNATNSQSMLEKTGAPENNPTSGPSSMPILVTHLKFVSVCPHHLLPYSGVAHLAYLPSDSLVGLGQLSRLLDCFSRRLVLQESLTYQIADALVRYLPSRGAACILEAYQSCLAHRGARQERHQCITAAYLGEFQNDASLQQFFLNRLHHSSG